MKRICLFFICAVICTLGACGNRSVPLPVLDFSAQVSICDDYGLKDLEAEVNSTMQGAVTIKLTSPDELWGLTYKWSDGFELIYDGLHCKTQKGYMPEEAFAEALYNVFCALSRVEQYSSFTGAVALYEGQCNSGQYKVITEKKGYIQNISIEEINLSADFTYE